MLSFFLVKNFRSILELKLDFPFAERKAPNGYQKLEVMPFIEVGKKRLVPCLAFFGANASGKSNILRAFCAFSFLVTDRIALSDFFEPNLLNKKFSDTTFIVELYLNAKCFQYSLTYNAKEILEETLSQNGNELYSVKGLQAHFSPTILSESYSAEKLSDILRVECSDGAGRQTKPFLNCIGQNYRGLNSELNHVFEFFTRRVIFTGPRNISLPDAVELLACTLDGNKKTALHKITDVVRRLDIEIESIDIVQKEIAADEDALEIRKNNPTKETKHDQRIKSSHKDASGKLTELDFIKHESDGTQKLAGLVGLVLYSLNAGCVLCVDELECSLHPLLMREIVMLFKTRRHNPKGAQLIFTTHNTDILDDTILRISEIALVKKTLANGTLVRRLADIRNEGEDIRNVTNFRKQYLAGFYSGIPHPAL